MSLLIKDMEMPTSIEKPLEIKIYPNGDVYCRNRGYGGWRAIPVPPHGRLIDADALKAKQQEDADLFQGSTAYCDKCRRDEAMNAVANIVNAPTILEAEEKKL